MPAALKKPTLDELYRRLSCTGGEGRESAMETLGDVHRMEYQTRIGQIGCRGATMET